MAKISETNPYLSTPEKRRAAVARFVRESSAIEGIYLKPGALKGDPAPPAEAESDLV